MSVEITRWVNNSGQVESQEWSLIDGDNTTVTENAGAKTIQIDASPGGGGSGTVTSVAATVPDGFTASGSPITSAGTIAIAFDAGYSLPTDAKQTNWDTAFGWGDHSTQGYLTSQTSHADVVVDGDFGSDGILVRSGGPGVYSVITNNSSNWDTAFSWGDHSGVGYLTESGTVSTSNNIAFLGSSDNVFADEDVIRVAIAFGIPPIPNVADLVIGSPTGDGTSGRVSVYDVSNSRLVSYGPTRVSASSATDIAFSFTNTGAGNFDLTVGGDIAADNLSGVNTGDETASGILTKIKTVDGALSGLDADMLDGNHASAFQTAITFGAGIETALGVNVGSAGAPVLFDGAAGTPSSIVLTNATGTASSLTAGTCTTIPNLSGDVTSSGNTTTISAGAIDLAMLSATGTPSSSTYLRGDNTWATIAGGGDLLAANNLSELTATASTARANLGLTIGTHVQAYDADLTTWAGLTPSANAQSLVTAADYAAMRALLDLEAGTDFYSIAATDSAIDTDVATHAALTSSVHGITAAAATVLDDATVAAMVNTLGGATSTGSGGLVRATSPTLVTPALGTPSSGNASNLTALNATQLTSGTIPAARVGTDHIDALTEIASALKAGTGTKLVTNGNDASLPIYTEKHAANHTISAAECYGGVHYVTSAATITLPAAEAGMSVTIITVGAIAVSVDPNASDLIMLDGVALDDGDKITNLSTTGDIAVLTYYDATGWYAATNGWTDGGA